MMLPILISVSVAPGSYFFCALALLASATARSPARLMDLAWLKTECCIIVLPDVLAAAQSFLWAARCGQPGEPSDRMRPQYARLGRRCQRRPGCYFPWHGRCFGLTRADFGVFENREREQGLSNEAVARTS